MPTQPSKLCAADDGQFKNLLRAAPFIVMYLHFCNFIYNIERSVQRSVNAEKSASIFRTETNRASISWALNYVERFTKFQGILTYYQYKFHIDITT